MKKAGFVLFLVLFLGVNLVYSQEQNPALNFSDITSGPKSGNTDGAGGLTKSEHGAIVTIWGNNLGNSQGDSKVYFKDSSGNSYGAARVYYWVNADGKSGDAPADLYKYQKMQEIAFSIPASAADGLGKIYVEVGGKKSNELDFTIRTGNIFFVKTAVNGGSNSNNGLWSSPWLTLDYVGNRAKAHTADAGGIADGDTIYVCDGVQEEIFDVGGAIRTPNGTVDRPISVIAYPGAHVLAQGTAAGIRNFNGDSSGWNFAKFVVKSAVTGISGFKDMRVIANEITNYPGSCATGSSGAICGGAAGNKDGVGGIKALGNYIHDWGCDSTSKLEHVFYLSNRGKSKVAGTDGNCYAALKDHISSADNAPVTGGHWGEYWVYWRAATQYDTAWQAGQPYTRSYVKSYELGWNYLSDNKAVYGLHVYDESVCGDFEGPLKIHDNVVVNQKGSAVDIGAGDSVSPCFTMDVEVYNNLFINDGIGPQPPGDGASGTGFAVYIHGSTLFSNIRFYNNTIYGYGDKSIGINGADPVTAPIAVDKNFAGKWEWKNNIVVDTKDISYEGIGYGMIYFRKAPNSSNNNIWYNGADGNPSAAPVWDVSPITVDPLFVDSFKQDFRILPFSPAIDSGNSDVSAIVKKDILGNSRPIDGNNDGMALYDIGAFEYSADISCDVNGDSVVNVIDVQLCVNVILGLETTPAIVQKAKAVIESKDECNVSDLQAIVNEILGS